MGPAAIRPARSTDIGFVLKSWVRNYSRSPWAGAYPAKRLATTIRDTVKDLLAMDGTRLAVACNPENDDAIWGFACDDVTHEFPVLHYVYVKPVFRGLGIGRQLVDWSLQENLERPRYTFKTKQTSRILQNATYKPGLIRAIWNPSNSTT